MIKILSPQARVVRRLLTAFSFTCIVCAAIVTVVPSFAESLQHLVHTGEPEWQEMYKHLIDNLPFALIIAAMFGMFVHGVYSHLSKILQWWVSLPRQTFFLIVIVSAAVVRIVWLFLFSSLPWADGIWYHQLALNLTEGKGYVWQDGTPTAFLPIGYPAILSVVYGLFGESLRMAKMFNLLLSVGMIPIMYGIVRTVWNERTARVGTLLFALAITHVAYVGLLFSEMLFTFILMAAIWFVVKSSDREYVSVFDVMIGISTGIGALIRPVGLLIPIALALAFLWKKVRLRIIVGRIAIMSIFAFMMLVPNIVRNYSLFDALIPLSTNGGVNFLIGNNPEATGYYMMPSRIRLTGNEVEQSAQGYALGTRWIASHPFDAVILMMKKLFHLYHRDDSGILFSCVTTQTSPPWLVAATSIVFGNGMYYVVLVLTIFYIIRYRSSLTLNEYFLIFLWCCVTMTYLAYFGAHRFHIPLIPVFIGFATAWIEGGLEYEERAIIIDKGDLE